MQPSFFDFEDRWENIRNLNAAKVLVRLNSQIDWEVFRAQLETIRLQERKSNAGRKPFDVILMFKIMVLQSLYNLSDEQAEFQIKDRMSFMQFLGLNWQSRVPDQKTIWLFREQLTKAGLVKPLFERFEQLLVEQGYEARQGQMVDATLVNVPIQRNSKDENERLKAGETPEDWSESKRRQKDTDARHTKKRNKNFFGYKNHANVDAEHKIIRDYNVTTASVHDSQVFDELLGPAESNPDIYADSAYRSKETEKTLEQANYKSHVHERAYRNKPLTDSQKEANRKRSRTRVRVEHVFGSQLQLAGDLVIRTIGIVRAKTKIGLRNLSYNLNRYSLLSSEVVAQ